MVNEYQLRGYVESIKTMIKFGELKNIRCEYDKYHHMYVLDIQERENIWSSACWFYVDKTCALKVTFGALLSDEAKTSNLFTLETFDQVFKHTIWPGILNILEKIENEQK